MLRDRPGRRPTRLRGYDYSRRGHYFVTIMTARRDEVFGAIVDGEMRLSAEGVRVVEVWASLPRHYPHVSLDAFVVMPNHVHGIVTFGLGPRPGHRARSAVRDRSRIQDARSARGERAARRARHSRLATKLLRADHPRRTRAPERSRYIAENPASWDDDDENPHLPRRNSGDADAPRTSQPPTTPLK